MESKDLILTKHKKIEHKGINAQNALVIGSVGTGKTRGFVKSNLLQKGCSFVVTDIKGDLYQEYKDFFETEQNKNMPAYKIQKIDLVNPHLSLHYNPFFYFKTDEDIVNFVDTLYLSANDNRIGREPFWDNMAKILILSAIYYLIEVMSPNEWTIFNVLKIINLANANTECESSYNNERIKSSYDSLMLEVKKKNHDSKAYSYYEKCSSATLNTFSSIVVSAQAILKVFELESVKYIMNNPEITGDNDFYDQNENQFIDFSIIGQERSVLFIILRDNDPSLNVIVAMLYTQLFQTLYKDASATIDKKLPQHVRMIMDDFANYTIPNISDIISSARSRNISLEMIIQSIPQLSYKYGQFQEKNILANCVIVYLGGNDFETITQVAQRTGRSIKDIQNTKDHFVFYPIGQTTIDQCCYYSEHRNYKYLPKINNENIILPSLLEYLFKKQKVKLLDTADIDEKILEAKQRNIEIKYEDVIDKLIFRKSLFDSDLEKKFEDLLQKELNSNENLMEYTFTRHMQLQNLFSSNNLNYNKTENSLRWKIINMHVDFVVHKKNCTDIRPDEIIAFEIDGMQHIFDDKQAENDKLKDRIFEYFGIELIRISSSEFQKENKELVNTSFSKLRRKNDEISDKIKIALQKLYYTNTNIDINNAIINTNKNDSEAWLFEESWDF